LGLFSVEFQMLDDDDTNPPDDEMLRRASGLVTYTGSHGEFILDIVFGYYLLAAEERDWMEDCGIPRGLPRNRIADYVREDRINLTQLRSMLFRYGMKSMHCRWSFVMVRLLLQTIHCLGLRQAFCDGTIDGRVLPWANVRTPASGQ
jgi:hypothetical protein